jgi:ATP-dependent RNA helicase DDX41
MSASIGIMIIIICLISSQTHEHVEHFANALHRDGYPELRTLLAMGECPLAICSKIFNQLKNSFADLTGGINMRDQYDTFKRGVHMVVATPGRLIDLLNKKKINVSCEIN